MRCDTCGKDVPEVSRVVIYTGYNKIAAKAIYNCPECFERKERSKTYSQPPSHQPPPPTERRDGH